MSAYFPLAVAFLWLCLVSPAPSLVPAQIIKGLSDEALMDLVQERTFRYFRDGAEPSSGMARERYHADGIYPRNDKHIVTTGGSGFGLMAIIVGIERGFITREQGVERFEKVISFLEIADRFHGVWPHWLDGETGRVSPFSRNDDGADLVETSFLVQGLLDVKQYLINGNAWEISLADRIDKMWRDVQWDWHRRNLEQFPWLESRGATHSFKLWQIKLDRPLPHRTHHIKVRAKDRWSVYKGNRIIRIVKNNK